MTTQSANKGRLWKFPYKLFCCIFGVWIAVTQGVLAIAFSHEARPTAQSSIFAFSASLCLLAFVFVKKTESKKKFLIAALIGFCVSYLICPPVGLVANKTAAALVENGYEIGNLEDKQRFMNDDRILISDFIRNVQEQSILVVLLLKPYLYVRLLFWPHLKAHA